MREIVLRGRKKGEKYTVHPVRTLWGTCYLIEADDGLYMVDTGEPGYTNKILRVMDKLGRRDLRLIFISHGHFDHYGNAAELRERTGAKIAVSRLDAPELRNGRSAVQYVRSGGILGKMFMPFCWILWKTRKTRPDILLEDGDPLAEYGLDATVLHLPGHTKGHCGLYLAGRYAFVGDELLVQPFPMVQSYYSNDWNQVIFSFEKLKALRPELMFPGYGRPIKDSELPKVRYKHIERLAKKGRSHW